MTPPLATKRTVDGVLLGSLAAGSSALAVMLLVLAAAPLRFLPLAPAFFIAGLLARKFPRRRAPQIALAALTATTVFAVIVLVTA